MSTPLKIRTEADTGLIHIIIGERVIGYVSSFQLALHATKPESVVISLEQQFPEGERKRHFLVGKDLQLTTELTLDHLGSLVPDLKSKENEGENPSSSD